MQWSDDVGPTTRIATVVNALQPSERRVVQLILDDTEGVVEITAQELADRAGVARSTVVRSCQSLGYRGYPQLRVALTRELARSSARASTAAGDDAHGPSALGRIRSHSSRSPSPCRASRASSRRRRWRTPSRASSAPAGS